MKSFGPCSGFFLRRGVHRIGAIRLMCLVLLFAGFALANGILTLRTGSQLTAAFNGCQGVWKSCRVDVVQGQNANGAPAGGRGPDLWFNTSAVTTPAPLTGGNIGAFNITGPGGSTLDFSVFKAFHFTEHKDLEFRAEAFNLPNKTQLGNPDMNKQDAAFGVITTSSTHGRCSSPCGCTPDARQPSVHSLAISILMQRRNILKIRRN